MRQLKLHRKFMNPQTRSALKWTYWIEDDGKTIWQDITNFDFVAVHIDMKRAVDGNFEPFGEFKPVCRTKFRSYVDIGGVADILATIADCVVLDDGSVQIIDDMGIIRDTSVDDNVRGASTTITEDDFIGVPV